MTARSRNFLKNLFITGYKPSQADFADVFDSFANKTDETIVTNENCQRLTLNGAQNIVFPTPYQLTDTWVFIGKPFCYDADGDVGYTISNETYTGFTVTPVSAPCTFTYKAIKL